MRMRRCQWLISGCPCHERNFVCGLSGIDTKPNDRDVFVKVRRLCAERGLDWDAMSEQAREDFIDESVHEDCACSH